MRGERRSRSSLITTQLRKVSWITVCALCLCVAAAPQILPPVPAQYSGKAAVLNVDGTGPLLGVLINGHWGRRFHHMIGPRWNLNLTPWMKFGEANEIELVCNGHVGQGKVNALSLDFHEPGVFP